MDAKRLVEIRKQAEQAVAEMPDGELKVKAFEVVLTHLLEASQMAPATTSERAAVPKPSGGKISATIGGLRSLSGRILVLKDEGFFNKQRTISEVREELSAHGWHYPLTTLSGALQALVRPPKNQLRRVRVQQGKRKIWKYSNP